MYDIARTTSVATKWIEIMFKQFKCESIFLLSTAINAKSIAHGTFIGLRTENDKPFGNDIAPLNTLHSNKMGRFATVYNQQRKRWKNECDSLPLSVSACVRIIGIEIQRKRRMNGDSPSIGHIGSALYMITTSTYDNCRRSRLALTLSMMCFRDKPRSSDFMLQ